MFTVETEVVQPSTYTVGDQEVNIAGVKATNYFITKVFGENGEVDEEKTATARARVFGPSPNPDQPSLYERLELDGSAEDPENPDTKKLLGKLIMTQMSSQIEEQRKTPTADEIAKAKIARQKPQSALMKNPKTGKVMVKYWPKVDEIFGLADQSAVTGSP